MESKRYFAGALGVGALVSGIAPPALADRQPDDPASPRIDGRSAVRLRPGADIPRSEVQQLLSALNDSYSEAVSNGVASPGAGIQRPFSEENVDIYEIDDPTGNSASRRGTAGDGTRQHRARLAVPAGTVVEPDGSMTPPVSAPGFALQAQGNWGEESGAHHSCIYDYLGAWTSYARNCTTWSWFKLAESNTQNDYWMVHAESSLINSGGGLRTKSGNHKSRTTNSSAGQREFRPLSGQTSGCHSINVNVSGSLAGVGIGTAFPLVQHCDRINPINPNGYPSSYMGVSYTGPDDGAVQARELGSTQVYRVSPSNNAAALIFSHGVGVGCYDNVCTGCAG